MSIRSAIQDVLGGAKNHEFWITFGKHDVRTKHRRSRLGRWWLTISIAVFVGVIGSLYKSLLGDGVPHYLTYICVGYVMWQYMQTIVSTGGRAIEESRPFLMQRSWPISTFIFRLSYREIYSFLYYAIVIVPVVLIEKSYPTLSGLLLSLLGLMLVFFASFWVGMIVALLTVRTRDFGPFVSSIMRMVFFATPVIWIDRQLNEFGEMVVLLNPFAYFITIVRAPLLGQTNIAFEWIVAVSIAVLCMCVAIGLLSAWRNKVTYWI